MLGFACASFWRLRLVRWLFTSCVWDVLRYRILIKTAFDSFGNVVVVVLYCVHLFWWFSHKPSEKYWPISPKAKHQVSKKTLSTFQKCLFERCSAFFFGCNKKKLFREPPQISLLGTIRVFFSNAVKFRLRQTSKATFGILALYILRLRCLVLSNTYKNSLQKQLLFLEQNRNLPKQCWVRSKKVFFELCWACFFGGN